MLFWRLHQASVTIFWLVLASSHFLPSSAFVPVGGIVNIKSFSPVSKANSLRISHSYSKPQDVSTSLWYSKKNEDSPASLVTPPRSLISPSFLLPLALLPKSLYAAASPTIITTASIMTPQLEMRLAVRLIVAAMLGATLGRERSFSKRYAGVRTMALVSLGAAVFTICSAYGFPQITGKYDPSRMAANVVSGVGFVGAGVITTSSQGEPQGAVRGLTTAATVWLSAAIGVACGVGLFRIAFVAVCTTLSILWMGRRKAVNRALRANLYERTHPSSEEDMEDL